MYVLVEYMHVKGNKINGRQHRNTCYAALPSLSVSRAKLNQEKIALAQVYVRR